MKQPGGWERSMGIRDEGQSGVYTGVGESTG